MIYKKIISKIPAISGLFLAGLFLPAKNGCCDDKSSKGNNTTKPQEQQRPNQVESNQVSSIPEPKDTTAGNNNKNDPSNDQLEHLDPYILDAVEKCKKFLIKISNLEYLGRDDHQILHYPLEGFTLKQGKKSNNKDEILSKLEGYIRSLYDENISALCYPPDLVKNSFQGLEDIVKNKNYERYPYAYAEAIHAITGPFKNLRDLYVEIIGNIKKLKSNAQVDDYVKKLDEWISKKNTWFASDRTFIDSPTKKYQLLPGPRLARFLRGQSKGNTHYIHVANLFSSNIISDIWLTLKPKSANIPIPDINDSGKNNVLNIRGAGIEAWKVSGGETGDTMPKIPSIDISQILDTSSTPVEMKSAINYTENGTEDKLDPENKLFTSITGTNAAIPNDQAVACQRNISFGQILFTLFKGSTANDFLKLEIDKKDAATVNFITVQAAYDKWITLAHGDPDNFAEKLLGHIQQDKDLSTLFFIPDIATIKTDFLKNMSPEQPANKGGNSSSIMSGSQIENLMKNIIRVFSIHQTLSSKPEELEKKFCDLHTLHTKDEFITSDANFNQRLCVQLAHELLTNHSFLLRDSKPKSCGNLIDIVASIIERECKKSIIMVKNRLPVRTDNTDQIISSLKELDNHLKAKLNSASITYKTIEMQAPKFSIDKVGNSFTDSCTALKAIIQTNVEPVMQMTDDTIDYKKYFDLFESLNPSYYPQIDKIRQEYQEKKNATVIKATETHSASGKSN